MLDSAIPQEATTLDCPICASRGQKLRAFSRRGNERTTLVHCSGCATAYLAPQPSDSWLAEEYRSYYDRRRTPEGKSANFRAFFAKYDPSRFSKVLEVGGGEGDCARELKTLAPHVELTVVESNTDCRAFFSGIDCQLEINTLETWLATAGTQKYDLILCFDVLEHLRDPSQTLSALTRHLNDGGEIWATFPNFDSLSRRLFGSFWPQYKNEHLFYFSRQAVEKLCADAGLTIRTLSPHEKELSLSYLLAVGSGFGPSPLKKTFGAIRSIVPKSIGNTQVRLRFGEWLLVARKEMTR